MRILELMRIDPIPNLAFEKPAGNQWPIPEQVGGNRSSTNSCASATELSRQIIDPLDRAPDCAEVRRSSSPVYARADPARPRSATSSILAGGRPAKVHPTASDCGPGEAGLFPQQPGHD